MSKFGLYLLPLLCISSVAAASHIRYEGNKLVSASELNQVEVHLGTAGADYVVDDNGTAYTLGQLDASHLSPGAVNVVLRAVSNYYQSRGILATKAEVTRNAYDAAKAGGDLQVRVLEGRIGTVRVTAADGSDVSDTTRSRILAEAGVKPGDALNGPALERSLAQMNRYSVSQVQPVLFSTPEGIVLEYRLVRGRPWSFGYTVDNYGSERTGRVRHTVSAGYAGLMGEDDRLTVSGVITSGGDSKYVSAEYFTPFGSMNQHRFRLSAYHAEYRSVDIGVLSSDFKGKSNGLIAAYEATLWNGNRTSLDLSTGVHFLNATQHGAQKFFGMDLPPIDGDTNFLLPFVDLKLSRQSASFGWVGGARIEANLPTVAGTDEHELRALGRENAVSDFIIGRLYGGFRMFIDPTTRYHEFTANGSYITSLGDKRLPASFLNVIGGETSVRGYPVAAVSGDTAASAQFEYRFHGLRLLAPGSRWDASLAVFWDVGAAEAADALAYELPDQISSYGVGFHLAYTSRFSASAEYAVALQDLNSAYDSTKAGDGKFYFSGTLSF